MKLFRFGAKGSERPGLLVDGLGRIDVSGFGEDYDEGFFASGGITRLSRWYTQKRRPLPAGGRRRADRAPAPPTEQDRVHRPQLPGARRGDRRGDPDRAPDFPQGAERARQARTTTS